MKEHALFSQVIIPFHPEFRKKENASLVSYAIKNPEIFNVTRLVEEAMAWNGGYEFVDGYHYDFSDGSECKTGSVHPAKKNGSKSHSCEITGVRSSSGKFKTGPIRAIIYIPNTHSLRFYFFPEEDWTKMVNVHPSSGVGRLQSSYNSDRDTIDKWARWEISDFLTLAKIHSFPTEKWNLQFEDGVLYVTNGIQKHRIDNPDLLSFTQPQYSNE